MARSSSSVETPISSALAKPASVFSGASPRAPRWPCRSKPCAGAAQSAAAAAIARSRFIAILSGPSAEAHPTVVDELSPDEQEESIDDPIEALDGGAADEPHPGPGRGDGKRRERGRGREVLGR